MYIDDLGFETVTITRRFIGLDGHECAEISYWNDEPLFVEYGLKGSLIDHIRKICLICKTRGHDGRFYDDGSGTKHGGIVDLKVNYRLLSGPSLILFL